MNSNKKTTFQAQSEQIIREEAARISRKIQLPKQTKEQSKLIAKGIEKGIALYKKQEKEKKRLRTKQQKKSAASAAQPVKAIDQPAPEARTAAEKRTVLLVCGTIFALVALAHIARYLMAVEVVIGTLTIPLFWSLPVAVATGGLAIWSFFAA